MPDPTTDQLAAQKTVLDSLHAEASAAEERRIRAENAVAATSNEFGHLSALMAAHTLRTDACLEELSAAMADEIETALKLRGQVIEFRTFQGEPIIATPGAGQVPSDLPGDKQKIELVDNQGRVVDRFDVDEIG